MSNKSLSSDWLYKLCLAIADDCDRMDIINGVDDIEECACDKCGGGCSCNADDDIDPTKFLLENKVLDLMEAHQEEVEECTDVWRKVNDYYNSPKMRIVMSSVIASAEEYAKAMNKYMRLVVGIIEEENEKENK